MLLGTPEYLAPKAILAPQDVDYRADLYAVGAVGYFLVSGHAVFGGGKTKEEATDEVAGRGGSVVAVAFRRSVTDRNYRSRGK